MKFYISKAENEKLMTLSKTIQSITEFSTKSTQYMLKAEDSYLYFFIYENGNIIKYSISIENLEKSERETGFFETDISTLTLSTEKLFKFGADKVCVEIKDLTPPTDSHEEEPDNRHLKMIISSGKNTISNNLVNKSSLSDFKEAFEVLDKKKEEFFNPSSGYLIINSDLMKFAQTVGKFISMAGSDRVSGISVEGNKIYYSDQSFSIVNKTLPTINTNQLEDGSYAKKFISQGLFNFLNNLQSAINEFKIEYSDSNEYIYINASPINLETIMVLPLVICEYPDENELANIRPLAENEYRFNINKSLFLQKMNLFDGVFPTSNWKWKTIEFKYDQENNKVVLSHSDFNSEVETDFEVELLNKTATEDLSFKMPSIVLYDYLQKIVSDETIVLSVSPLSPADDHGLGFVLELSDSNIVLAKLLDEEQF